MRQQIRWAHRTVRFLVEAVGSAPLTVAAEPLGAFEASGLSLLGLVGAVRAPGTLLLAVAAHAGVFTSRASLTSLVAFAFILEVLPRTARHWTCAGTLQGRHLHWTLVYRPRWQRYASQCCSVECIGGDR